MASFRAGLGTSRRGAVRCARGADPSTAARPGAKNQQLLCPAELNHWCFFCCAMRQFPFLTQCVERGQRDSLTTFIIIFASRFLSGRSQPGFALIRLCSHNRNFTSSILIPCEQGKISRYENLVLFAAHTFANGARQNAQEETWDLSCPRCSQPQASWQLGAQSEHHPTHCRLFVHGRNAENGAGSLGGHDKPWRTLTRSLMIIPSFFGEYLESQLVCLVRVALICFLSPGQCGIKVFQKFCSFL